jgi:NAD(P)-dependent dehydrogenase (short-subunit alcohol dehydrogenase family)
MPDREHAASADEGSMRKAALITGGTRGIGLGVARELARDGWDLLLSGQRPAHEVASVIDDLKASGRRVEYVAGNIASPEGRAAILDRARTAYGVVNALVNNAGRARPCRPD